MKNSVYCLAMFLALGLSSVYAADIACTIERGAEGEVAVSWAGGMLTDGYAVKCGSNLADSAWKYSGNLDHWPTDETNRTIQAETPLGFYKITESDRGHLIEAKAMSTNLVSLINFYLMAAGLTEFSANYDVVVYKITYDTFDHRDQSTTASGALAVPVGASGVPLLSCQHGTMFEQTNAPSVNYDSQALGIAFASEGYVTAMPDYIGLGTNSPALHPYLHSRSEAVAAVDMLRASKYFVTNSLSVNLNGELFVAGYSQGGHVTLVLQRELETYHASEFSLVVSAPMAGPHDLSGIMRNLLLSDIAYDSPSYLGYIFFGYNAVYNFFNDPSEALKPAYAVSLPPLFDGEHSGGEIDAAMPSIPKEIFTTEFLSDFETNMTSVFNRGLMTNDTYKWIPAVTTRLYHCAADETVPIMNTIIAHSNFVANGSVHVSRRDPSPTSDHTGGVVPCFNAANVWFESL